jgi:hypothetical protein
VHRPNKKPRIDLAFTIVEEVKDEATQKWFTSLEEIYLFASKAARTSTYSCDSLKTSTLSGQVI